MIMKRTNKEIISQIRILLDEIEGTSAFNSTSAKPMLVVKDKKKTAGCIGAILQFVGGEAKWCGALSPAPGLCGWF